MPKCVPCLGTAIKQAVLGANPDLAKDLARIADCPDPMELNLCSTKGKGKRQPSAYQAFTRDCLRAKHLTHFDPQAMRDCAAAWRQRKGA